ncbi:amino acid ABC transporter membrane protein (PAAT family) [Scopulibacillus darangshiensis]|uniref:Amino acid ABC transporter membrane protein (PAAT family) n=1 Tax=Scopulibacillus darangshiensis TaxID=442528 RepID=A0A4R2NX33_9BACL|nr:amino acid ABC transporter permease [Scopulibacillus darangshiensis]TCP25975.1 amino acid ABC transporter membrane protein (PAAT family) [Scopulibacillus darangshiensis]
MDFGQWFVPFGEVAPLILKGFWITIEVTIVGLFFGFILGAIAGLARLSRNKIIYSIATVYVEVVRGTPILLQIFFVYFGLAALLNITFGALTAAFIALAFNSGAYIAEIVRGAVFSIEKGQMEAGRSIGLTHTQAMRYVIWPQAIKRMIPPLGNQFIISLKDSSLFSVIALGEIVYKGQQYIATTYNYGQTYITIAVAYLIITIPLSLILRQIERRLDVS